MSSPVPSRALVLVPSYNPGRRLLSTVREALAVWPDVLVVDDASTDDSLASLESLREAHPGLRLLRRPANGGKGAAVLDGGAAALAWGFSHALVLDADGQHPSESIRPFMDLSAAHPEALVLGVPLFGPEAPKLRLYGRQLSVGMVAFEVWGSRIRDPLFGFRVYPLEPLVRVMRALHWGRRYDFDPELAVRLVWAGVPVINEPASCRYVPREQGGVSHFHYFRDNVRMVALHTRLVTEFLLLRWWRLGRSGRELRVRAP